jgi:hypothetical protein
LALRGYGWLGHSATLHSRAKPPPHFVGPGNAAHFLVRAAKPSYTAGTLCAIFWSKICKIKRVLTVYQNWYMLYYMAYDIVILEEAKEFLDKLEPKMMANHIEP